MTSKPDGGGDDKRYLTLAFNDHFGTSISAALFLDALDLLVPYCDRPADRPTDRLKNIDIDIDKEILENINIDKISNRLEFGISKVFSESKILDALILNFLNDC